MTILATKKLNLAKKGRPLCVQVRANSMIRGLIPILVTISGLAAAIPARTCAEDLRKAVRSGDVDRVRTLLESGADANRQYENRFTSIYFVSNPQILDLLIAHGAKLNIRDAASVRSPIERAAANFFRDKKRRDDWKLIVDKLRAAGAEYTIDTATYMNDIQFVKEQLAADASWVNKRRGAQSAPLRVAARTGRAEICKLLLEHKADPDSFEIFSGYPIMIHAVQHPAVVKLLIEHGANLKRRITWKGNRTGPRIIGDECTVLHHAVCAGNLESVKLLIAADLDPNAADDRGHTPLHIALLFERIHSCEDDTSAYPKIIEYLLEQDASL